MTPDLQTSFESPQVEARPTLAYIGGFILFVGLSLIVLRFFFVDRIIGGPTPPHPTPAPQLETHSGQTLAAVRRAEDAKASSYAWIDRANERVRIPVARAMQIVAARGTSAYDPLPPPQPKPPTLPP